MQIDWSTVVLETVNFLILVWILQRFLYRPVLDIIARRKAGIDATVEGAEGARREADALKQRYEGRLAEWEREQAAAREASRHELAAERQRAMDALQAELQAGREKARVADERRLVEAQRSVEQQAVAQSARFAARLLEGLAGPELDARLVALLLAELAGLPAEEASRLRAQPAEGPREAEVASARPLEPALRGMITAALDALLGQPVACRFREEPALIAGLRITLGPWVLRANLRDELQAFAELSHGPSAD